jgi:hypothetical protein
VRKPQCSHLWKWCCARDGGRSSGIALQGEVPNHRRLRRLNAVRGERCGKRRDVITSGVGQEVERERTADDVSQMIPVASKPGHDLGSGMSLGGACRLPRRRPACRQREPDLGSCAERGNLSPRHCRRPGGRRRQGDPQAATTGRGGVPSRGTGADRLVAVMKPGKAGGAKETGHLGLLGGQPVFPG